VLFRIRPTHGRWQGFAVGELTDRKHELRRLLTGLPTSRLQYADHVEQHGTALFQRVCEMDLEGIVAKHSLAPYTMERTTWFKIKNRSYSQMQGREELLSVNAIRNPYQAGTLVNWLARR